MPPLQSRRFAAFCWAPANPANSPADRCGLCCARRFRADDLKLHVPKNTPHKEEEESHTIQSEEPDYEYAHR